MSLDWPAGWERTPTRDRSPNRSFEASLGDTIDDLEQEMGRLNVDDWRLSTGLDHQSRNPNRPYANQPEPEDPGVVVRWSKDGEQFAVACDTYSRARDNLRSVFLWIHETRMRSQRPVTTGESEFAAARLPSGDDAVNATAAPHEVLEVTPDAGPEEVRDAFREKAKETHPDGNGGSREAFEQVKEAKEAMLDE